jgi:plasmid stability protein
MIVGRNSEQVNFRLPDGMRTELASVAAMNGRSMNSEVIRIFERALEGAKATTGAGFADTTPAVAPDSAALQGGSIHQRS